MSLMREKPGLAIAVVAFCLIFAGWMAFGRGNSSAAPTDQRWFYDLETGELVALSFSLDNLPPITLDNGHEAVGAHVFTCGKCEDNDARQVGYIEMYTDYGKEQMRNPTDQLSPDPSQDMQQGPMQLIAFPGDDPKWVDINGMMGAQVMQQARAALCPDGSARECFPGQ